MFSFLFSYKLRTDFLISTIIKTNEAENKKYIDSILKFYFSRLT